MLRIQIDQEAYLSAAKTGAIEPAVRLAAERARAPDGSLPAAVVWDGAWESDGRPVRLGPAPLDDLLLGQLDVSDCCAVLEPVLGRLNDRGAIRGRSDTSGALALLARDGRATIVQAEGPVGRLRPAAGARRLRPVVRPELISIVLLTSPDAAGVELFLDSLRPQRLGGSGVEVLVLAANLDPERGRALTALLDRRSGAPGAPRIRPFLLPGSFGDAYLANTGLALASGDAVVVARAECIPESDECIATLAAWALSAETLTASPRIHDGSAGLVSAGLSAAPKATSGAEFAPWSTALLDRVTRRVAAPAPWFFAANRKAWLELGGAGPRQEPLWTASLAREARGAGRHLLVGSESAVWVGDRLPAGLSTLISTATLSSEARRAARLMPAAGKVVAQRPVQSRLIELESPDVAAVTDPFPSSAPIRLLVIADAYGASQSIAFVEGLADARRTGRAAVRLFEEAALGPDGADFDEARASALIQAQMAQVRPTHIVLSRLGHARGYDVLIKAGRSAGAALVFHIDDDLFELPVCVGIDRYRTARHPRRIHTAHRAMAEADLTLAATPALAERLLKLGQPRRVTALSIGSAGQPRATRAVRGSDQPLVVGYMGSASHNADLEMIAPALNAILGRYDQVSIELFGSISDQPAAELLRGRVRRRKAVAGDYGMFRRTFAALNWDIGLAPLRAIPYNLCKTPTKWVEYAEAGAATVVSNVDVYSPMIEAGAALAAGPDGWERAIARLIENQDLRRGVIAAADRLLGEQYAWDRLERSVLEALRSAEAPRALAA
jgi:glycosyltransferase involved in cell wall biosynthesis